MERAGSLVAIAGRSGSTMARSCAASTSKRPMRSGSTGVPFATSLPSFVLRMPLAWVASSAPTSSSSFLYWALKPNGSTSDLASSRIRLSPSFAVRMQYLDEQFFDRLRACGLATAPSLRREVLQNLSGTGREEEFAFAERHVTGSGPGPLTRTTCTPGSLIFRLKLVGWLRYTTPSFVRPPT